jgi:hypothetical protein
MRHNTLRLPRFVAVVCLIVLANHGAAQPNTKVTYKILTSADLQDGQKEEKLPYKTIFLASLNRAGKQGWEVVAETERGLFARKNKPGEAWEYRIVKAPDSPLNGRSDDDEILQLVFDGLAAKGWTLCLIRTDEETRNVGVKQFNMVFKRAFALDEKKATMDTKKGTTEGLRFNPDGSLSIEPRAVALPPHIVLPDSKK